MECNSHFKMAVDIYSALIFSVWKKLNGMSVLTYRFTEVRLLIQTERCGWCSSEMWFDLLVDKLVCEREWLFREHVCIKVKSFFLSCYKNHLNHDEKWCLAQTEKSNRNTYFKSVDCKHYFSCFIYFGLPNPVHADLTSSRVQI